jgi:hypothetical protein
MEQIFDQKFDSIMEGFGGPVTRKVYAPRIPLSEEFKAAFREEYKRLCKPEPILNEEDQVIRYKEKNPQKVLEQIQKSLLFLAR